MILPDSLYLSFWFWKETTWYIEWWKLIQNSNNNLWSLCQHTHTHTNTKNKKTKHTHTTNHAQSITQTTTKKKKKKKKNQNNQMKDALRRRWRGRRTQSRPDVGTRHAVTHQIKCRLLARTDRRPHRRHRSLLQKSKGNTFFSSIFEPFHHHS